MTNNDTKEKILKEFEEKFGEDFYDLHIRACRIVDTDEHDTQKWCNDFKNDLKNRIVLYLDQIRQSTLSEIIEGLPEERIISHKVSWDDEGDQYFGDGFNACRSQIKELIEKEIK